MHARKSAIDTISRALAITRYDIEHHQAINDLSLNIHGENYFRDLFNELYNLNLLNANFGTANAPCIDLIDRDRKLAYQITTTRTKEKIRNTLRALRIDAYKDFTVRIFYLLEKAKPTKETFEELEEEFSVKVDGMLFDYENILKDLGDLEESKLLGICAKFFASINEKYTDHIALDLVIKHLLKHQSKIMKDYDDSFGSIATNEKIRINRLNARISSQLSLGLDYRPLLDNLDEDGDAISRLRQLIVDEFYGDILTQVVSEKVRLQNRRYAIVELHDLASESNCDFNKVLNKLNLKIQSEIGLEDYNSPNVSWAIIGFFFEICDVGVQK